MEYYIFFEIFIIMFTKYLVPRGETATVDAYLNPHS